MALNYAKTIKIVLLSLPDSSDVFNKNFHESHASNSVSKCHRYIKENKINTLTAFHNFTLSRADPKHYPPNWKTKGNARYNVKVYLLTILIVLKKTLLNAC